MNDQASVLRSLMESRAGIVSLELPPEATGTARTIAVTSGKGGVGKTNVALNLAIALAETGERVCLLDANPGLGNVDLLCGLNGYWNLAHVRTGARQLKDVVLSGPAGLSVIPGAGSLGESTDSPDAGRDHLMEQLAALEAEHDFIVIDTAYGTGRGVRQLVAAADDVLVVTTPEPTSIADAYAAVKALAGTRHVHYGTASADNRQRTPDDAGPDGAADGCSLESVINQAESPAQAAAISERLRHTARLFLQAEVGSAGWIPRDHHVSMAVSERRPFYVNYPHSPASQAVQRLAQRMKKLAESRLPRGGFFSRIGENRGRKAA